MMKFSSRFMKFVGGRDLIFILLVLILLGIVIFIYDKVAFIFNPVKIIFSTLFPPIVLAFIAYYLLNPIVNLLERFRIKRIWGIILLILGIGGLITSLIFIIAPIIELQIKDLINTFPSYLKQMGLRIQSWMEASVFQSYYEQGYEWVAANLSNLPQQIGNSLDNAYKGIRNIATTVTNVIVAIITFPIILFFLLKDGTTFKKYSIKLLPPRYRSDVNLILRNMDEQVGSYIQGQIIVATCIGVLLYIGYLIIGLDYAIILALIAAVTSVVPYLGPIIAISPAIIIAIVHSPFMLLKLAIVWAAVQFLEGNFISPNVMGKTMKVHPLTIIFVLLVAGNLFGLVGVILGIPGYALIKVVVQYIYEKFKQRYNFYYGEKYGAYELEKNDETLK